MQDPSFFRCGCRDLALALAVLLALPLRLQTAPPPWWQRSGAVATSAPQNDFAALNQGQLKSLARAAAAEMNASLPHGGAGSVINTMVQGWLDASGAGQGNDYAAVNVGQLKTVARPFYTRLNQVNFGISLPWPVSTLDDSDFVIANIGQAKTVFSFDLDRDGDGDGISDIDEGIGGSEAGGNAIDTDEDGTPDIHDGDSDDDGLTDSEERAAGTDPRVKDSDGDRAEDGADAFPADPYRFLRVKRYAAVNIGAALAPPGATNWYPKISGITNDNDIAVAYDVGAGQLGVAVLVHGATHPVRNTFDKTTTFDIAGDDVPVTFDLHVSTDINPKASITGLGQLAVAGWYQGVYERHLQGYLTGSAAETPAYVEQRQLSGQTDFGLAFGEHYEDYWVNPACFMGAWSDEASQAEMDDYDILLNTEHFRSPPSAATLQSAGGDVVGGVNSNSSFEDVALRTLAGTVITLFPVAEGHLDAVNGTAGHPIAAGVRNGVPFYFEGATSRNFDTLLPEGMRPGIQVSWTDALNQKGDVIFSAEISVGSDWRSAQLLLVRTSSGSEVYELEGVGSVSSFGTGFNNHLLMCRGGSLLLPVELVEVTPALKDEAGAEIPNSTKPKYLPQVNDMVEEPITGQIPKVAYRVLKVKVPKEVLAGEKVKWSMTPQFTPEGATEPRFRGVWPAAPHADRFEAAPGNAYGFERISQAEGRTTIDAEGFFAVRINLPPIGYNKARVKLEFEKYPGAYSEVDFEVPAVVVIDPGHGGTTNEPGSSFNNATSPTGVKEKDLALSYGLALRDALKAKVQQDKLNVKVLMTRDVDINKSGADRAAKARDNGADNIFIIHFNASAAPHSARGTLEVRQLPSQVNLDEDIALIDPIISSIVTAMTPFDAGANKRSFVATDTSVAFDPKLGNTAAYHPIRAGYCEVEFLDNAAVDVLLNTGANAGAVKTAIVGAMRDGILRDLKRQPAAP